MGCPVHIWVPMAAALTPVATMARHRLRLLLPQRSSDENPAERIEEMPRWSPVATTTDSRGD